MGSENLFYSALLCVWWCLSSLLQSLYNNKTFYSNTGSLLGDLLCCIDLTSSTVCWHSQLLQGNKPLTPVFIAVNDVGLHLIAVDTKVNLCYIRTVLWMLIRSTSRQYGCPLCQTKSENHCVLWMFIYFFRHHLGSILKTFPHAVHYSWSSSMFPKTNSQFSPLFVFYSIVQRGITNAKQAWLCYICVPNLTGVWQIQRPQIWAGVKQNVHFWPITHTT